MFLKALVSGKGLLGILLTWYSSCQFKKPTLFWCFERHCREPVGCTPFTFLSILYTVFSLHPKYANCVISWMLIGSSVCENCAPITLAALPKQLATIESGLSPNKQDLKTAKSLGMFGPHHIQSTFVCRAYSQTCLDFPCQPA